MTSRDIGAELAGVLAQPAWAVVRTEGSSDVVALGGEARALETLADIPLDPGPPPAGRPIDRLVCIPYAQVRERGFAAHDDGAPLVSIEAELSMRWPVDELLSVLGDREPPVATHAGFQTDDAEYARLVRRIIDDEIGNGAGANVVIGRDFTAQLADWDAQAALGVLARLLRRERGAYWTFVIYTGDRYLIGASPERHVLVEHGTVSMNPISGTFRLADGDPARLRDRLLAFLADEKEIFELFMVVDEELKMMCALCQEGGAVLGPFLKPMSHLVHTEYVLRGRSTLDPRDVLRGTMFAATVTGSPVENACRVIARYEDHGRGYYGSVLAAIGRSPDGSPRVDAPIALRTAAVAPDGALRVTAGATLVRDSDPGSEVAETRAKAAGILSAFGLAPTAAVPTADVTSLVREPEVREALASRNQRLSTFWLAEQSDVTADERLVGKHVVVLDGEDDFVAMLRHLLGVLGMTSSVVSYRDLEPTSFDAADLVIVGPGPGDPRDSSDPKIAIIRSAVRGLLAGARPFLAVCLGHQALAAELGLDLVYKDIVFQGTQTAVELLGESELVGFYNTFVARVGTAGLPPGVSVSTDPATEDIHLLRGPHFAGIQFHAESILTEHGFAILRRLVGDLLTT